MCCIQVRADVLLRNVLGYREIKAIGISKISISDIGKCGIYLENNLPGYVDCETDEQVLSRTAELCGYLVDEDKKIDLDCINDIDLRCNRIYPDQLANRIEEIIQVFFEEKLYEENRNIIRMKNIYAN